MLAGRCGEFNHADRVSGFSSLTALTAVTDPYARRFRLIRREAVSGSERAPGVVVLEELEHAKREMREFMRKSSDTALRAMRII